MRVLTTLVAVVCCWVPATAQTTEAMSAAASSGDWPAVATMAKSRIRRTPSDAIAWTFLGLAESNLGHTQAALDALSRSVKLAPGNAAAHTNYGATLERAGQKQEAAAEYTRSLRIDPRQPSALVNLARLETEGGDPGRVKAVMHLREAWALAPDPEIAASLLILEPCASPPYEGYVARVADAQSLDPSLSLQAAHAMEVCARWTDAERIFRATLAASNQLPDQRDTAATGLARAEIHLSRIDDAEAVLIAAMQSGPETPKLLAALAEVEQRRGHYDLAVPALLRAVTLAPGDEDIRFRYGMLLLDARTPKAAELRTRDALDRLPNSSRLWFLLGLAYFDQDDTRSAGAAFDHALTLDPRFAAALAYRGLVASQQQHDAEAAAFYRKAIAVEPASADLYCLLAETLENAHPEDKSLAYAELERAARIDPSAPRQYLMMGRIDLDQGRPERAIAELQKALALNTPSEQVHFFLARAYRQLHQPELAAQEAALFAKLSAASSTRERDDLEHAIRQLGQTRF